METKFTAHNILLDNGVKTMPEIPTVMPDYPWFKAAKRVIEMVYPNDKKNISVMDLGCYEGGYAVEFARMGLKALGVEVRQSNIDLCNYVKKNVALDNLNFIRDDAWNAQDYGAFDIVFCCGLLYHIDRPRTFMRMLSKVAKKILILQTHYAVEKPNAKFGLSPDLVLNEGAAGRWYTEFPNEAVFQARENNRGASWDNWKSFWLTKEWILQSLSDGGYDMIFEQFDGLGEKIVESMTAGEYAENNRSTFVGIRTDIK